MIDPLCGYIKIAEHLISKVPLNESYNLGPRDNSNLTVLEVCTTALNRWETQLGLEIVNNPDNSLKEAMLLSLDSSLALQDLNWQTKLSAEEAINWTVDWEKNV